MFLLHIFFHCPDFSSYFDYIIFTLVILTINYTNEQRSFFLMKFLVIRLPFSD